MAKLKYACLACEHIEFIESTKESYQEVRVCPKCKGALIDLWCSLKYAGKNKTSLLKIELDSYNSVPKVFYKGEEITGKISVSFDWNTKDTDKSVRTRIKIVHCEDKSEPAIKTIAYEPIEIE